MAPLHAVPPNCRHGRSQSSAIICPLLRVAKEAEKARRKERKELGGKEKREGRTTSSQICWQPLHHTSNRLQEQPPYLSGGDPKVVQRSQELDRH